MKLEDRKFFLAFAVAGALVSTAVLADQMFLGFNGEIAGDSTDPQHAGEIEVLSYSIGTKAETSWTKGGGASVGKPNPGDLHFTAVWDRSVPTITSYITTGKAAQKATLTLRKGKQSNYAKYIFDSVFFTSAGQQGADGDGRAVSDVAFVYKIMTIQNFAPGSSTPLNCVTWDIPAGTVSTTC